MRVRTPRVPDELLPILPPRRNIHQCDWFIPPYGVVCEYIIYSLFAKSEINDDLPCQSGPILAFHGSDNTIGSTRSGNFSGMLWTRRLVEYSRSPTKLEIQFELVSPITVPWIPKPVTFDYYKDDFIVESICAGTVFRAFPKTVSVERKSHRIAKKATG